MGSGTRWLNISGVSLILALLTLGGTGADSRKHGLLKFNDYKFLNVNSINAVINSDGTFADYRYTNNSGMEWPKGSGKTCVFTSGLWLMGIHHYYGNIRTACWDYASEYQPGPLLEVFNTVTNDGSAANARASDNKWRLYKINRSDSANPSGNVDYMEWPGDAGAPYVDVNGNGTWDAGIDYPKVYGDQQLWTVTNDVNSALHSVLGTTPPMGVEVRCLYYAFNQPGTLGNTAFMKWIIVNRSDVDYDNAYVAIWADVDLGDGNDDLPGCDTTLNMAYAYNGTNNDGTSHGYGLNPPAAAFVSLVGPALPGLISDSAIVDGKWRRGFKNLPLTASVVYTNSTTPALMDPPAGSPNFAAIAYDYMQGKDGTVHQTLVSPTTGTPMYKWFTGDPVAGNGDLPANFPIGVFNPQDIRIMLSSGPFNLAQGDTQVIDGAFVIAQGTDRLASVTKLKQSVSLVRDFFYGSMEASAVGGKQRAMPDSYALEQNYPNPFNPTTTIAYTIPVETYYNTSLRVYDLLGREVAVLVNERKAPGRYEVTFDGSRLASGVYVYRLTAGNTVETRTMTLLR